MASSFRGSRYGIVLLLILADVALISGTSVRGWTYLAAVVLQGVTLLACLHAARVPVAEQRVAAGLLLVAVLSVALTRVHAGDEPGTFARAVNGGLVAVAPVVIARDLWTHPRVTGHTVAGALCVYLLVGMLFSALLGLTAATVHESVFLHHGDGTEADRLYFSFVTLTTTGYGDLAPGVGAARALAVLEALIGQLYLVTVVAVLVSRVGPLRRSGGT
jgi:hypothetical protein